MTILDLHSLDKIIGEWRTEYTVGELGESHVDQLTEFGAEAAFYWYGTGSYEGSGYLLALRAKKWYVTSLSHCSCYGPEEGISKLIDQIGYDSLITIEQSGTKEAQADIIPLIQLARDRGYGEAKPDDLIVGLL